ncbi:MAG: hypothetical protein ABIP06_11440 [Pyrinomonadaceae bacterium]
MTNKSKMLKILSFALVVTGFLLLAGVLSEVTAQTRDPFAKAEWAKPKNTSPSTSPGSSNSSSSKPATAAKPKPTGPIVVAPPAIEARISYYKRLREEAATGGMELPKVTSVLTLEEMSVTGIFRTPRGYAAMVEAKPIKLSYTIYPGEKFFDGQLVAIEENRLVFRKVTKMSDGKFISAVENKALRQYSVQETVQGTAPITPTSGATETATTETPIQTEDKDKKNNPSLIVSPVDEMNKQTPDANKDTAKEVTGKKGKKIAKNKKQ